MKRREFVIAGVVGIGSVGLGSAFVRGHSSRPVSRGRSDFDHVKAVSGESISESRSGQSVTPPDSVIEAERVRAGVALKALLLPLSAGSTVASAMIESIRVDEWQTGEVVLRDASGAHFQIDVCRRDERARAARIDYTERYDVFLHNGGDGNKPSDESHAVAALAIGSVIRTNEAAVPVVPLVAKGDDWRTEYWNRV